jgi:hypothetical protein
VAVVYKTRDVRGALRSAIVAYEYVALNTHKSFGDVSETTKGVPTLRARGVPRPSTIARWRKEKSVLCTTRVLRESCDCLVFRNTPTSTLQFDTASACATEAIVLPLPPTWRFHELQTDSEAPSRAHVENLALAILSTPEDPRLLHCALACDTLPAGLIVCDSRELIKTARMYPQALLGAISSLRMAGWVAYYRRLLVLRVKRPVEQCAMNFGRVKDGVINAYDMGGDKLFEVRGADDLWMLKAMERQGFVSVRSTLLLFAVRSEVLPDMGVIEGRHQWLRQMLATMRRRVEEAPWFE